MLGMHCIALGTMIFFGTFFFFFWSFFYQNVPWIFKSDKNNFMFSSFVVLLLLFILGIIVH
jgi:hypothetical protein